MSMNQFSTDPPETLWWEENPQQTAMEQNPNSPPSEPNKFLTRYPDPSWPLSHLYHHHQQSSWFNSYNPQEPRPSMFPTQNPFLNFNLQHEDIIDGDQDLVQEDQQQQQEAAALQHRRLDKEPMFEKPLTPSDVGKLNRLVIPKQHAEKYFPLSGDSTDKGLLLSFEDESGKCWRFRYSYWNSSQSYVLTKGWSRYVKEKQLDAGDVVFFERHRTDCGRLFIGWRRRGDSSSSGVAVQGSSSGVWSRGLYSSSSAGHQAYPSSNTMQHGDGANVATTCVPYQPDCLHAGSVPQDQTAITVGNSKRRLRLFGVNLECQLDESEPSTSDGSSMSPSQGPANQQQLYYSQSAYSYDNQNQMDITFSEDVNHMRNRRG